MSPWLPHSAMTARLSVVPSARIFTHPRHLQPPTAYYSQILLSYNYHLHSHYIRHYSTQRPQSTTSSAPAQPTQAHQSFAAPLSKQDDKSNVPAEPVPPLMTRVWTKVKHEASHYWHGTKLLASDIRISSRLLGSLLRGKTLTRRERRQLRRTTNDLLRLIPFSVFIIVPFMELLLPVAIKLFPNMLPSTFEDKFAAEEKQRKLLRVRLEMAKLLQETLRESGLKGTLKIVSSDEFKEFFRKVRSTGEQPSVDDILTVAKLFSDDLTLDNLSRPQLISICRYLGLNAFGTDNFLKGYIRRRLEHIKRDDELIAAEGVDSLSTSELQHASSSRGLRTVGVSPARLREQMNTWTQLHLKEGVSGVLLILSRAYGLDRDLGGKGTSPDGEVWRNLEAVLSGLPDNLLNEAELEVDEKASYKQKLDVLKEQEELIEDEAEQEHKEEAARRQKKAVDERARREEEARMAKSLLPDSELQAEPIVGEIPDARMTTEQLGELGEALSVLSARSSVLKERRELRALMEENLAADEDPSAPSDPLAKKIRTMLGNLDKQLKAYDEKVGSSLQIVRLDPHGKISVHDLEQALGVIKHAPSPEVVHGVVQKLDVDGDGFVVLEHVLDLIGEEGLGIVVDDEAQTLIGQGHEFKEAKPRKEDIVQE